MAPNGQVIRLISGFEREERYYVGEGDGSCHAPNCTGQGSLIHLPALSHDCLQLLKAALNVVVGEEKVLKGPEDLTDETTAQTGLYTHPPSR
jgi:hypothetical protein